jgi:hypothetical protein
LNTFSPAHTILPFAPTAFRCPYTWYSGIGGGGTIGFRCATAGCEEEALANGATASNGSREEDTGTVDPLAASVRDVSMDAYSPLASSVCSSVDGSTAIAVSPDREAVTYGDPTARNDGESGEELSSLANA